MMPAETHPPIQRVPLKDAFAFLRHTTDFLTAHYHLGDFFRVDLPLRDVYAVTGPEVLQYVLVRNEKNYVRSKIYWGQLKALAGRALATMEGDEYVWMRKLQMKYYSAGATKNYMKDLMEGIETGMEGWRGKTESFDVIHAFSKQNISVILWLLYGVKNHEKYEEVAHAIADLEEIIYWRSTFPWRPYTAWLNGRNFRHLKHAKFFDGFATEVIRNHIKDPESLKLLDVLIDNMNEGGERCVGLEEIRNELVINLGASTETAAVAMGWTVYLLHSHPDYLAGVRAELEEVTQGETVTEHHLAGLKLLTLAVKESMRLYPPSHAIIRDAVEEDEIMGEKIKKGSTLFVSAYALHRNPRWWKNPNDFVPERFADESQLPKYAYIPFGAGRHTCIGRYIGLPMVILTLAAFLQKFEVSVENTEAPGVQPWSTLKPAVPVMVKLKERKQR